MRLDGGAAHHRFVLGWAGLIWAKQSRPAQVGTLLPDDGLVGVAPVLATQRKLHPVDPADHAVAGLAWDIAGDVPARDALGVEALQDFILLCRPFDTVKISYWCAHSRSPFPRP